MGLGLESIRARRVRSSGLTRCYMLDLHDVRKNPQASGDRRLVHDKGKLLWKGVRGHKTRAGLQYQAQPGCRSTSHSTVQAAYYILRSGQCPLPRRGDEHGVLERGLLR
jgi:hypothetical protein